MAGNQVLWQSKSEFGGKLCEFLIRGLHYLLTLPCDIEPRWPREPIWINFMLQNKEKRVLCFRVPAVLFVNAFRQ